MSELDTQSAVRLQNLISRVEFAAVLCGQRVGFRLAWVTAAGGSMHLHADTTFYDGGDAEVMRHLCRLCTVCEGDQHVTLQGPSGATHTWHVTEGTTYVLNRTASGRDAVQSAVPGLNFYMEHQVHCQTNTCTIVLDLKGPSALVDELAVLPPWNWPSGPVFNSLQQMEGLPSPSPVPSLPQLKPGELGHLIKALPPAHLVDWKTAAIKAKCERGVAWMAIARENVHVARELNLPSLATPAQWVMALKEETGHAYIPAARAAVQAAEREGRPELRTDQQAPGGNNVGQFIVHLRMMASVLQKLPLQVKHRGLAKLLAAKPNAEVLTENQCQRVKQHLFLFPANFCRLIKDTPARIAASALHKNIASSVSNFIMCHTQSLAVTYRVTSS